MTAFYAFTTIDLGKKTNRLYVIHPSVIHASSDLLNGQKVGKCIGKCLILSNFTYRFRGDNNFLKLYNETEI
jgi:hypothetical protein